MPPRVPLHRAGSQGCMKSGWGSPVAPSVKSALKSDFRWPTHRAAMYAVRIHAKLCHVCATQEIGTTLNKVVRGVALDIPCTPRATASQAATRSQESANLGYRIQSNSITGDTSMEELFKQFASSISLGVEIIVVLLIAFGAIEAFLRLLRPLFGGPATHGYRKAIWIRFGMWLLLGLEFELAAEIVQTVISPTWVDLGKLASIAVIRTFLNYFLEKDIEKYSEAKERAPEVMTAREASAASHRRARLSDCNGRVAAIVAELTSGSLTRRAASKEDHGLIAARHDADGQREIGPCF